MKAKPILWSYYKTKSKEYPIKIRVTETTEGKTNVQYYPIDFSVKKDDWDAKAGRVKMDRRANAAEINLKIISLVTQIEKNFLKDEDARPGEKDSFYWWFQERINYSKIKHGTYNHDNLVSVLKNLKEYAPTLSLKQLNDEFIKAYETHILAKGNHVNTVAFHLARIRMVAKIVSKSRRDFINPFDGIKISKEKTKKHRPDQDALKKLMDLKIGKDHPSVQLAVQMFFYSFYNGGIRFGDLCRQRWDMIENGRLRYTMNKSKVEKNIKLHPWVINMLKKLPKKGPYIFNTGVDWNDEDNSIKKRNSFFRTKLKTACRWAGIPEFAYHVTRNIITDMAVKKKVSPLAMKNILGHAKLSTTEEYMKSFYMDENDEALDAIFEK